MVPRELQLAWFTSPSVDESVSGANTSVASGGGGGEGNISGAGSSIAGDGKEKQNGIELLIQYKPFIG